MEAIVKNHHKPIQSFRDPGGKILIDSGRVFRLVHESALADLNHFLDSSIAHIILPHSPFLFKQDGSIYEDSFQMTIDSWGNRQKYKEQLIFLNQKVKPMIEAILSRSPRPPIIILQGDHGPASTTNFDNPSARGISERMGILNAYFLPAGGSKDLYNSITPVNSFRIIFNRYFNTKLPLERDNVYFSSWVLPYKFLDVTTLRE